MERLIVRDVSKEAGETRLLDHVDMELFSGKIYGIVGRNDSGKTVLLKCICGFMPVTEGVIIQDGMRIGVDTEFIRDAGFIIENPAFLPRKTGYENLRYLAGIRRIADDARIRQCMDRVGLSVEFDKPVGKYSLGMRQRLGIAQAIMEDPSFLILDEPMNGLDNHSVDKMRELLGELREEGKTLLVVSHNREDIELLCDSVYVMDRGALTKTGKRKYYY